MRILIANDDGIHAPGIRALHTAIHDLGETHVVAPHAEQSAVGHAITLSNPIRCLPVEKDGVFFGHAIGGTPADCVKLAVEALLPQRPDVVVSGINLGPNAGISVIYSGTVSAATEGTILGIPSMAISLATFTNPIWDTPARVARDLLPKLLRNGLPPETLLNVNVPNLPFDQIKGYRVTTMGRSRFTEVFHRRTDPRGNVYYWMDGEMKNLDDDNGTDIKALEAGYVSLTPIWFDLTNRAVFEDFKKQWA